MPSSSNHDTAVEKHIQSLCLLIFARLSAAEIPVNNLSRVMERFLATLDMDPEWLHKILDDKEQPSDKDDNEAGSTKNVQAANELQQLREQLQQLEDQGRQLRRSVIFAEVATACNEVARLLNGKGRASEASTWAVFAADCQKDAEFVQREEEVRTRLRAINIL